MGFRLQCTIHVFKDMTFIDRLLRAKQDKIQPGEPHCLVASDQRFFAARTGIYGTSRNASKSCGWNRRSFCLKGFRI